MIDLLGHKNFIDGFGNPKYLVTDGDQVSCYGFSKCKPKCIVDYKIGPSQIYTFTDPMTEMTYIEYSTSLQKVVDNSTLPYNGTLVFYIYYKYDDSNNINSPSQLVNKDGTPTFGTQIYKSVVNVIDTAEVSSQKIYPDVPDKDQYAYAIAYKPDCCCTEWLIANDVWHVSK